MSNIKAYCGNTSTSAAVTCADDETDDDECVHEIIATYGNGANSLSRGQCKKCGMVWIDNKEEGYADLTLFYPSTAANW